MTTTYDPNNYYDTASMTLRAVHSFLSKARIFDEEKPDTTEGGLTSWATRIQTSINGTDISWHIVADNMGVVDIARNTVFLKPNDEPVTHTVIIEQLDLNELSREQFSSIICETILGVPYIPMRSRKEVRRWEDVARMNAGYAFRIGMQRILGNALGGMGWEEADNADRWAMILDEARNGSGNPHLGTVLPTWKEFCVQFSLEDVYGDAFTDRAVDLMQTIYRTKDGSFLPEMVTPW